MLAIQVGKAEPSSRCSRRQRGVSLQAGKNSRNVGATTASRSPWEKTHSSHLKKIQDLASYFSCHTLSQSSVYLLYIRTLQLDLMSFALKCFIYFPKNRQLCLRTQGEILTLLKALRVCHRRQQNSTFIQSYNRVTGLGSGFSSLLVLDALKDEPNNPIALSSMPTVPKARKKQHQSPPALSGKQLQSLKRKICSPLL